MKITCIYKIVNIKNNHKYVGSTIDFDRRKIIHTNLLNKGKHHSRYLQNAWNFHGENNFEFSVIETIDDVSKLLNREQYYINVLNPEYNTMRDIKSHLGLKRSKETCEKISKALTGKKLSKDHIEKLRKNSTGVTPSKETIEKLKYSLKHSVKHQTAVRSKERNDKIKATRLKNGGYIVTDDHKKRISETLKLKNLQSATSIIIQKYDLNETFICEYKSLYKAEKDNGLYRGSLSYNINKLNRKIYKGFIWKQINK